LGQDFFFFFKTSCLPVGQNRSHVVGKKRPGWENNHLIWSRIRRREKYTSARHAPLCCEQESLSFQTSCLRCFNKRTISLCHHANEPIEEYI